MAIISKIMVYDYDFQETDERIENLEEEVNKLELDGAEDGQVLVWNEEAGQWLPQSIPAHEGQMYMKVTGEMVEFSHENIEGDNNE